MFWASCGLEFWLGVFSASGGYYRNDAANFAACSFFSMATTIRPTRTPNIGARLLTLCSISLRDSPPHTACWKYCGYRTGSGTAKVSGKTRWQTKEQGKCQKKGFLYEWMCDKGRIRRNRQCLAREDQTRSALRKERCPAPVDGFTDRVYDLLQTPDFRANPTEEAQDLTTTAAEGVERDRIRSVLPPTASSTR